MPIPSQGRKSEERRIEVLKLEEQSKVACTEHKWSLSIAR